MQLRHYDTDLADTAWELVAPLLPAARPVDGRGFRSWSDYT
jgi:hypothetical protein